MLLADINIEYVLFDQIKALIRFRTVPYLREIYEKNLAPI